MAFSRVADRADGRSRRTSGDANTSTPSPGKRPLPAAVPAPPAPPAASTGSRPGAAPVARRGAPTPPLPIQALFGRQPRQPRLAAGDPAPIAADAALSPRDTERGPLPAPV